jgi:Ceramidase
MSKKSSIFSLFLAVIAVSFWLTNPIPQNLAYHDFADQRTILGIQNFWNVLSNLPIFFIGIYGLRIRLIDWEKRPAGLLDWIPLMMSFGIFATSLGSAYYHFSPSNDTLLWDRLPMTLVFMSLMSLVFLDTLGVQVGARAFIFGIPFGIFSVLYWHFSEKMGQGDLRFYGLVQFFPLFSAPFLMFIYRKKITYFRLLVFVLAWYSIAKMGEHFDKPIFDALGFMSGHTIKHFCAAVSLFFSVKILEHRFPKTGLT